MIHVFMCLQGIIVGLDNLDGVIHIIKEMPSHATASAALMKGMNPYNLMAKLGQANSSVFTFYSLA